jgi:hypothetical protein
VLPLDLTNQRPKGEISPKLPVHRIVFEAGVGVFGSYGRLGRYGGAIVVSVGIAKACLVVRDGAQSSAENRR